MLENNPVDESTPTDAPIDSGAPEAGDPPAAPAKKAAAKRAPAKKAAAKKTTTRKTAAKKTAAAEEPAAADLPAAADPVADVPTDAPADVPATKATKRAPAKRTTTRKTAAKKVAAADPQTGTPSVDAVVDTPPVAPDAPAAEAPAAAVENTPSTPAVLFQAPVVTQTPRRRTRKVAAPAPAVEDAPAATTTEPAPATPPQAVVADGSADGSVAAPVEAPAAPTVTTTTRRSRRRPAATPPPEATETDEATEATEAAPAEEPAAEPVPAAEPATSDTSDADGTDEAEGETDTDSGEGEGGGRRRRRRGGRRRRKSGDGPSDDSGDEQDSRQGNGRQGGRQSAAKTQSESAGQAEESAPAEQQEDKQSDKDGKQDGRGRQGGREADDDQGEGTSRRRRRRRRSGDDGPDNGDDGEQTVSRSRKPRNAEDEITAISGSTRLEAKKQRRRDGREAGRRRAPIVSEAEFLARREAVERVMVIRQRKELTQIAVLEDKVLVEHYVARESQTSIIGNVYLGRVQNVLPSMEAAFIDIGKGRNAVLYAGEVNWSALGHKDGQPRKIESVLSSGQSVLVQVTKDPIGHKGARLTSQVSLAGRFLVYVPDGTTSGISRKLPDTERARLKALLKEIVPESAGVIVRTAAEGASEDELTRDVERLKARWEDIEAKVKGSSPQLLYGEPDLTLKVVRDLFTEDFSKLVIEGDDAWDTVEGYVKHVAPDLADRLERYDAAPFNGKDSFAAYRVDEQIAKGLDRKVWLPSGGSLVIDRTEAMTVVDVNTGKFTGSGGNLEETVTKNNLEAAEEMVRQLRLRDIGGIIVIDFIDMVLESNRDLVLRRLVECLGRDRTRHQVAEVTSLGLVQMTRKRIGTGLVEAFSENCPHCQGRGVVIQDTPVDPDHSHDDDHRRGGHGNAGGGAGGGTGSGRRSRGGRGRGQDGNDQSGQSGQQGGGEAPVKPVPSPTYVAAVARPENTPVEVTEPEPAATSPVETPAVETPAEVTPPVETPAEAPVAEAPEVETPEVETPKVETPVAETPEETPEAEPVAPAAVDGKPKVVTRTSRRTGVVTVPAPQPVEPATAEAPAPAPATPLAEPVQAPVVPPTEKPKVVTRTRGRGSRS